MSNGPCHPLYLDGISFPGCLPAEQFLAASVSAIYNAPILTFG